MAKQITIINPTDEVSTAYEFRGKYPYISTYGKDDEGNYYECYWFIPHASVIAYEPMDNWVDWYTPHGWRMLDSDEMDEEEYNWWLETNRMGEGTVWLEDDRDLFYDKSRLWNDTIIRAMDEYDEAKEKAESEEKE